MIDLTPENAAEHYDDPREREARETRRSIFVGIVVFTALATLLFVFVRFASGIGAS